MCYFVGCCELCVGCCLSVMCVRGVRVVYFVAVCGCGVLLWPLRLVV